MHVGRRRPTSRGLPRNQNEMRRGRMGLKRYILSCVGMCRERMTRIRPGPATGGQRMKLEHRMQCTRRTDCRLRTDSPSTSRMPESILRWSVGVADPKLISGWARSSKVRRLSTCQVLRFYFESYVLDMRIQNLNMIATSIVRLVGSKPGGWKLLLPGTWAGRWIANTSDS